MSSFTANSSYDPETEATIRRLRSKYSSSKTALNAYELAQPSSYSSSTTATSATTATSYHPSLNGKLTDGTTDLSTKATVEDMEGYERLARVKICATCGGQGKTRKQYNHYYVDVDCEDCDGEGTVKLESVTALIQKSKDMKATATTLFKQGSADSAKYKEADDIFAQGLALIAPFRVGVEASSLRVALLLNRAACCLKMQEWQACCDHCEIVLKTDASNVKALWRSSVSFEKLGDIAKSMELLKRMLVKEPSHTLALHRLEEIQSWGDDVLTGAMKEVESGADEKKREE